MFSVSRTFKNDRADEVTATISVDNWGGTTIKFESPDGTLTQKWTATEAKELLELWNIADDNAAVQQN